MLNAEKYRDEIQKILDRGYKVALNKKTKKVVACEETSCNDCAFWTLKSGCCEIEKWLISEYKEQILTEEEKEYLKAVIKPFKKHVKTIMKAKQVATLYAITIDIEEKYNYETFLQFPPFEKSSGMYKGMELGKAYTIEELEL